MDENKFQVLTESDIEYKSVIKRLKTEYKKKINEEIEKGKNDIAKLSTDVLGRDFALLVIERKKLVSNFSSQGKALLEYAVSNGMTQEVEDLKKWSESKEDISSKKQKGASLFSILVNKVELLRPDLVDSLKKTEKLLDDNNDQIILIVDSKKTQLEKIKVEKRKELQQKVVDLVLEFNKKLLVINDSFGIVSKKQPSSPLDGVDDFKFDIDGGYEDDIFVPPGADDIIN